MILILLLAVLLLSSCTTNSDSPKQNFTSEMQLCQTDNECVPFPQPCGTQTCLNIEYQPLFMYDKDIDYICTAQYNFKDIKSRDDCVCHQNTCTNKKTHPYYQIKEFMTEIPKTLIVNPFRDDNDEITYFGLKNNNSFDTK